MLSLPAAVLLIPYALFLLGFTFFAFANILSLGKYGARNAVGLLATFIFVSGTAVIMLFTWKSLAAVDWKEPVPLAEAPELTF